MKMGTKIGTTFLERRAIDVTVERIDMKAGVVHAAVRVSRFWAPFYFAEMVSPWWAKPLVFAWAAWRFWVLRDF